MSENKAEIIKATSTFVYKKLQGAEAGHDWWHILRVWNLAKHIAQMEERDTYIIELSALLHDISDPKFNNGDEKQGPAIARNFLKIIGASKETIRAVVIIIERISFRHSFEDQKHEISPELAIVQDADRLDAMGAIGIARTFHYGGYKNREIYNPDIPAAEFQSKEAYATSTAPSINHFYEKLLHLKSLMNTKAGTALAQERHDFMAKYLDQFYKEWNV